MTTSDSDINVYYSSSLKKAVSYFNYGRVEQCGYSPAHNSYLQITNGEILKCTVHVDTVPVPAWNSN